MQLKGSAAESGEGVLVKKKVSFKLKCAQEARSKYPHEKFH